MSACEGEKVKDLNASSDKMLQEFLNESQGLDLLADPTLQDLIVTEMKESGAFGAALSKQAAENKEKGTMVAGRANAVARPTFLAPAATGASSHGTAQSGDCGESPKSGKGTNKET